MRPPIDFAFAFAPASALAPAALASAPASSLTSPALGTCGLRLVTCGVRLGTLAAGLLVASMALTATAATVASAATPGLPQPSENTTTSAAPTTSTTSISASTSKAASGTSGTLAIPAGLDINHASEADLDSLVGVGPALTARILAQRAVAPFADWADLIKRVKGIRQATAHRLAEQGVTVNGQRP